jgi:GNAT superfamily N-acetyltransferase
VDSHNLGRFHWHRLIDRIYFTACTEDIPVWSDLARQVESPFGAFIADDEGFPQTLQRKIDNGLAFCIRENDGPPGAPLCGGLLFSTRHHPVYQIGWLAVAETWQRFGVGRALVMHACGLVTPPAEVIVTSFDAYTPGGEPWIRSLRITAWRGSEWGNPSAFP